MLQESPNREDKSRSALTPRVVGVVIVVVYFIFIGSSFLWVDGWIAQLMHDHYAFFVGLPFAALISYVLVSVLEYTKGKIELEALQVKFKGASGPIVLWIMVFLSWILAIRLIWGLKP